MKYYHSEDPNILFTFLLFLYCSLLYNMYIFCMYECVCVVGPIFCAQLGS